jgi:nucleoside-diphosphate-sugar epimerase
MALTRLFTCLDAGQPFDIYGDGRQSRDVTFVGDAVEATIRAMASPRAHGVYNIGGGDELTLLDLIARAEEVTGIDCSRNFLPAAPGDMRRTCASTVRANRELGWAPQTELTDGLKRQWAWIAEGPAVQYGERRQTAARDLLRLWHVPLSRRLTLSEA